ncbi:DUF898 domain-containing protein [Cupriavidus respiraculi]|uniref:YjgN family protein n=1 Tax=Cupriavidus respiraculi TaxID=195930 RepID=UPI001C950073|nr:DUF898 domain-containing protein [Cupriavidus respiraculi]
MNDTAFASDSPAGAEPMSATAANAAPRPLRMAFTGSGSEYFRIWIVNTLLTIVTLGIYSAWAKVRTLQYFYRNTRLDGATFDYHGRPLAILKGRAIVLVLAVLFQSSSQVSPWLTVVLALALAVAFPLLLVRSLRFRMANSSYRGLRFSFSGGDRDGYRVILLWPLLTMLSLYTLAPLAHQRFKQFQHGHTRFGTAPFAFSATARQFYVMYLGVAGVVIGIAAALLLLQAVVAGALGTGAAVHPAGAVAALMLAIFAVGPVFGARLQNLVWNRTTLAPHTFRSEVNAGRLFLIHVTNLLGIALTLGLFLPFARVRAARYRLQAVTMMAAGPLDAFVAQETAQVGALGDAAADWYDIDIAL